MIQRFLPLSILCLLAFAAYGQNPVVPGFDYFDPHPNLGPQTRVCSSTIWDAGTSNQTLDASAQSNDVEYLCFNDILDIDHNGDFNLDPAEDPIPGTQAGICYVFYGCTPTSTGPDLTNINSDPCNNFTPAAPGPGFLYLVANPNVNTVGDGSFENNGGLQTFFNGGDPIELFFAPITVGDHQDAVSGAPEFEAPSTTDDFCTNVTVSDAFRVVYLNEIAASSINNNEGDVCTASFIVSGGLSEFDALNGGASNYTINIVQNGDPTITGTIISGTATHGSTVIFTVPSAGTYDVTVEDGKSCGAAFSVDMSACVAATPFSATYTETDVTCNGADDGTVVVDIIGGTPGFTFDWQLQPGGAIQSGTLVAGTQFTISALTPGTYGITVTDNDADQDISSFTITEPGALGANLTNIVQPTCNGGTGSMSVEIFEGGVVITPDASYSFIWAGTAQTTQTITNIPAGNAYTVTITNGNGCTAEASGTLSQPAAISAPPITGTDASCIGVADGSATITASGGTGVLTYNWDTTPAQTAATATNLEPGTYNVNVEDENGCIYTDGITIGATTVLTASAAATDITCNGANDGSITITPTVVGVDNGGYTFTWNPNVGAGATLNSLGVNTYTVLVTDANGCTATTQEDIAEPTALSINTNVTHESCNVGNDGSITTSVSGGTPLVTGGYNYTWSNIETTADITNLGGDTYTVTVTDANNCMVVATDIVNSPNGPTIVAITPTNVSCATSTNGSITVTALPGNDPIATYAWNTTPIQTTATATDLSPGDYTVTVTDAGGCGVTETTTVAAPPALVEATPAVTTTPFCEGGGEGTITLDIDGGVEPYNYDWSNGSTGPAFSTLTNLIADTYTVTIIDANGCTLEVAGIVVADPPAINVLFENIQPVTCFGAVSPNCDGEATVTASGGLSINYTFTWPSGETSTGGSSTAVQLCQGNQTVTVTDGFCTVEFNMSDFGLEIPAPPVVGIADIMTEDVSCFGDIDGTATIVPTGGDGGPYNIVWSNGQTGDTATGLAPTEYTVSITDGLGCESVPFTITIGEPTPLQLAITDTIDISCSGDANGSIQVAPIGGNAGLFTYEWTPNTTNTLNTAVQLSPGTYSVTVTDIKGCTATNEALIEEPSPIYFEYTQPEEPLCFGDATVFGIDLITGGGGEPYIYTIDGFNYQSSNQASPVLAGDYTILITDSLGCEIEEELIITQPAEIIVDLGPDVEIQLGESYEIIPTVTPLGALDVLEWTPATWLSCDTCFNPIATPLDDQVYTLTVVDSDGCFGSDDIFIDIDPNRNVFIPNAFTPNADGANDFFAPYIGPGVENINSIHVFDRWGELVYFTQNFVPDGIGNNGWDGTLGGKLMNTGVFVYVIEVAFSDNELRTYKGDVTLLR